MWNNQEITDYFRHFQLRIQKYLGPIVPLWSPSPTGRGFRADVVTHVSLIKVRGRRMVFKVERTIWILPLPPASKNESLLENQMCEQALLTFIH